MTASKPLWAHQIKRIERTCEPDVHELLLADDMGTGKTRSIIEILRRRYAAKGRVMNTLIVAPRAAKRQWKTQILEYSKLKPIDILVLEKSEKRRCKDFYDLINVDGQLLRNKIVIINPASFEMKELMKLIEQWHVEILVIDEVHEFKAHNGVRAKAAIPIADKAEYRYFATGTLIANTESDVFMPFRLLDGGQTFGTNFYVFRKKYYRDVNASWAHKQNHFPKYECSEEGKAEISKLIFKKAMRALKKDCLDLPPLVREELEVELSPEQKKAYNEMKEEFLTWVKDQQDQPRAIVANLAITKAMKMQQIISGFAFDENRNPVRFKNVPRLEVLRELLTNLGKDKKVIIWATFIENYKMIAEVCEDLGMGYIKIVGGQSDSERAEDKLRFQTDPKCQVCIANQSAGGTGVDGLQVANYMVYYSKDASLLKDSQSNDRAYRGGSEMHDKVTRIDLVAYGTLDEGINDALANKKDLAQYILDKEIL